MPIEFTAEMVEEQNRKVRESARLHLLEMELRASQGIDSTTGKHTCGPSCRCRIVEPADFAERAAARIKPKATPTAEHRAPGGPQERWTLIVPGCPVSKGRPQFAGTPKCPKCQFILPRPRTFTPADTVNAEKEIRTLVKSNHPARPFSGRLAVRVRFFLPDHRRVDTDNLVKLVLDALNPPTQKVSDGEGVHRVPILDGAVWRDDSQICRLLAEKDYDPDNPRTEIEVEELPLPILPLFGNKSDTP